MTSPPVLDAVDGLLSWATAVLCELIAEPSLTGDEQRAQERFARVLRDLSLDVDMWCPVAADVVGHASFYDDGVPLGERPVVVGRWGDDENRPTLVLNGHMDVVPAGDAAKWSHDPWNGTVADGRIYGRGACDMKGGLVAAVLAIAALQQAGVEPATNVLVHSVIGEETGGVGTLAAILRGYAGDAAIILEPTGMDVCPVGAGAASFRLVVHGRAAHAALRQDGVSSVELFGELMGAMAAFESERHAGFSHPAFPDDFLVAPVSVGRVAAGDWPSTVPELLVAEGRCGVLPGERLADARRRFEQCIAGAATGGRWSGVAPPTVEWFEGQFEPGETPPEAPLLHALARAHAEVVGARPRLRGVSYGSDLRLFTNDAGVPAVLYGPGDATVAHAVDEHVPIEQLRHVAKVIALILAQEDPAALFDAR